MRRRPAGRPRPVSTPLDGRDDPIIATLHVELAHQRVRTEEAAGSTAAVARAALDVAERFGVDVPAARNVLATSLAHDGLHGWEEAYREVIPEAAACWRWGDGVLGELPVGVAPGVRRTLRRIDRPARGDDRSGDRAR